MGNGLLVGIGVWAGDIGAERLVLQKGFNQVHLLFLNGHNFFLLFPFVVSLLLIGVMFCFSMASTKKCRLMVCWIGSSNGFGDGTGGHDGFRGFGGSIG